MAENQPRDFDAVFGGDVAPEASGIVLGGLEGVKNRLKSSNIEVQTAALTDALNYGDAGFDLLIEALQDSSEQVRHFAAKLLKRDEIKGKQALLKHEPWLFFTKLEDWKIENFNPLVGITDTDNTAYLVHETKPFKLDHFEALLKEPKANQLEALICGEYFKGYSFYGKSIWKGYSSFINRVNSSKYLTNIKALFIGDRRRKCSITSLKAEDIYEILYRHPRLEFLKMRCHVFSIRDNYKFENLKQPQYEQLKLKTLIIENERIINQALAKIEHLYIPTLEYFELWLNGASISQTTNSLLPLLFGKAYPKLTYLGLHASNDTDQLTYDLVESPIVESLLILDLSMGNMTDKGGEALLRCPAINRLHTLNIANNKLSMSMIQKLSALDCRVITQAGVFKQHEDFLID